MPWTLVLVAGCSTPPTSPAIYRSGANAIVRGEVAGQVKVWGPDGTVERLASPGPDGTSLLGQAGPLWRFDRDVAAPPKAPVVAATVVERAGWRMREVLGGEASGIDPARGSGVYVRSVVKVRRDNAPPIYTIAATGDEVGAGRMGGPPDLRAGKSCQAAVATMDDKGERLLSAHALPDATGLCVVPVQVPPLDTDGDGILDLLVHGQSGDKGFRAWFVLHPDGTLVPGLSDAWEGIP